MWSMDNEGAMLARSFLHWKCNWILCPVQWIDQNFVLLDEHEASQVGLIFSTSSTVHFISFWKRSVPVHQHHRSALLFTHLDEMIWKSLPSSVPTTYPNLVVAFPCRCILQHPEIDYTSLIATSTSGRSRRCQLWDQIVNFLASSALIERFYQQNGWGHFIPPDAKWMFAVHYKKLGTSCSGSYSTHVFLLKLRIACVKCCQLDVQVYLIALLVLKSHDFVNWHHLCPALDFHLRRCQVCEDIGFEIDNVKLSQFAIFLQPVLIYYQIMPPS